MDAGALQIGQVAKDAGLTTATIRYYEKQGLVPPPSRSEAGYRHYAPEVVHRLKFISKAKSLGFTLTEIGELLELRAAPSDDCSSVLEKAQSKLTDIEAKIKELEKIRTALRMLVRSCNGAHALEDCFILGAMQEDGS